MRIFVKPKLSKLLNVYAIGITSDESRWHESEAMFDLFVSFYYSASGMRQWG